MGLYNGTERAGACPEGFEASFAWGMGVVEEWKIQGKGLQTLPRFSTDDAFYPTHAGECEMSVLKPRTRVVYFRLSEDEYEQLSRFCVNGNARSVSDFARSAVQEMLQRERSVEPEMMKIIQQLDKAIHQLTKRLDQLAASR